MLQQGLARFPHSLALYEALVRFAKRTRDLDLEDDAQSSAFNLFESTAGPKLRKAWRAILRSDWAAMDAALNDAVRLDPTDARIPAYRAVAFERQGRQADASIAWFTALALEEARLSYDESSVSAGVSRSPTSLGLVLTLRHRAIGAVNDPAAILDLAKGAALHAQRINIGDRSMLVWRYLLPDPAIESTPGRDHAGLYRWAPNAATVAAAAHVAYGRALASSGDTTAARAEFEQAILWGQPAGVDIPRSAGISAPSDLERDFNNGVATGAIAEAYLEMARLAAASRDIRAALDFYNKAVTSKPSPAVRQQLEQVLESIRNPNQPAPQDRRRTNPFGRKKNQN